MRIPWLTPGQALAAATALGRSGLVRAYRPDQLARIGLGMTRYQLGPGMGPTVGASCYPQAPGLVDDAGVLSMRQLDQRCSAVAHGLATAGLAAGDGVGLLMRNSAAFYQVAVGASRLGADLVYLNTGFPPTQVADVVARQRLRLLVYDAEFADRVPAGIRAVPATDHPGAASASVAAMAAGPSRPLGRSGRLSRHVILTSGTTRVPRGVARAGGGVESVVALLSGLPLRVRETHLIAAPMFHAWGWLHLLLTMLLSSTVVVTRRFDPRQVLATVARERCQVLVAVPTMMQKIMDLPAADRRRYDTGSLRLIAVSGSALSARLAREVLDEFGDVLYSLYGSTEAGFATVAGPADLRAAPGTAGRPLPAVRVRVLDRQGRDCPPGVPGAIRVSGRDAVGTGDDPAVRTGDLGWLDEAGRLFIGAREDDMVIVGGENVYPVLVEHALEEHPEIVEAAVVGIPDPVLGQVLVAHVALRAGGTATPAAIRAWSRRYLAPFQVPARVVVHPVLPRNETGKVVKSALARPVRRSRRGGPAGSG